MGYEANFVRDVGPSILKTAAWGVPAFGAYKWVENMLGPSYQEKVKALEEERLIAYKHIFPNDLNPTDFELDNFVQTVDKLDTTFGGGNFEYQNDVYKGMVDLYGSAQGPIGELYDSLQTTELGAVFVGLFGVVFAINSGVSAIQTGIDTKDYIWDKNYERKRA